MTCPTCNGYGEIGVCVNDGKAGCSHVNDRTWPCPDCDEPQEPETRPLAARGSEAP